MFKRLRELFKKGPPMDRDLSGKKYLRVGAEKPRMKILLDFDFSCVQRNYNQTLYRDKFGDYYFMCIHGKHYIHSSMDPTEKFYIGIYPDV